MTVYSMTVTSSVKVFGSDPTDLWGAYNWNAFAWGEGTRPIPKNIRHLLTGQALTLSSSRNFRLTKLLTGQSLTLDSARASYLLARLISAGSITFSSDMESETLQDSTGYDYVYPGGQTNAHNRVTTTWSETTSSSAGWSTATVTTTTWS